jgi:hypothetical protein
VPAVFAGEMAHGLEKPLQTFEAFFAFDPKQINFLKE